MTRYVKIKTNIHGLQGQIGTIFDSDCRDRSEYVFFPLYTNSPSYPVNRADFDDVKLAGKGPMGQ